MAARNAQMVAPSDIDDHRKVELAANEREPRIREGRGRPPRQSQAYASLLLPLSAIKEFWGGHKSRETTGRLGNAQRQRL